MFEYTIVSDDGGTQASISSLGGTVLSFRVGGNDIFFPQYTTENGKVRGGCHICAPWFGGSLFSTRKHGYLRDISLDGLQRCDNDSISMEFDQPGNKEYPWHLWYNSTVVVQNNELLMILRIHHLNDGVKEKAPINIGFHPYFAVSGSIQDVKIKGLADEKTSYLFSDKSLSISLGDKRDILIDLPQWKIAMDLEGFTSINAYSPYIVLWSDDPKKYACIEPVVSDHKIFNTRNGYFLDVGDVMILSMTLRVEMKT